MKNILLKIILYYQMYLSPDHSQWGKKKHPYGYCPFHPSCSEYAQQALQKHTIRKALFLTFHRVIRCHPWSKGGLDMP